MSRNSIRFSADERQRIQTMRQSMTLRQLAARYRCSTGKIIRALGKWRYPRIGSYKAVSQ